MLNLNEGDIIKAVCQKLNLRTGDGIFKYKNFIIIVKDTKVYFEYNIKIIKVLPNMAFGEVI
jgi:predicted RNA-binding protein with TRAM domain